MSLNFKDLSGFKKYEPEPAEPPQYPPTILDVQRTGGQIDMMLPLADPCPTCGAFRMQVGDWVCWGECFVCFHKALLEMNRHHDEDFK